MSDIFGVLQIAVDKRARQLASLTSQVSAQGRLIDRRLQYIDDLETQVGHHGALTFLFSDLRCAVLVCNLFKLDQKQCQRTMDSFLSIYLLLLLSFSCIFFILYF